VAQASMPLDQRMAAKGERSPGDGGEALVISERGARNRNTPSLLWKGKTGEVMSWGKALTNGLNRTKTG